MVFALPVTVDTKFFIRAYVWCIKELDEVNVRKEYIFGVI